MINTYKHRELQILKGSNFYFNTKKKTIKNLNIKLFSIRLFLLTTVKQNVNCFVKLITSTSKSYF